MKRSRPASQLSSSAAKRQKTASPNGTELDQCIPVVVECDGNKFFVIARADETVRELKESIENTFEENYGVRVSIVCMRLDSVDLNWGIEMKHFICTSSNRIHIRAITNKEKQKMKVKLMPPATGDKKEQRPLLRDQSVMISHLKEQVKQELTEKKKKEQSGTSKREKKELASKPISSVPAKQNDSNPSPSSSSSSSSTSSSGSSSSSDSESSSSEDSDSSESKQENEQAFDQFRQTINQNSSNKKTSLSLSALPKNKSNVGAQVLLDLGTKGSAMVYPSPKKTKTNTSTNNVPPTDKETTLFSQSTITQSQPLSPLLSSASDSEDEGNALLSLAADAKKFNSNAFVPPSNRSNLFKTPQPPHKKSKLKSFLSSSSSSTPQSSGFALLSSKTKNRK